MAENTKVFHIVDIETGRPVPGTGSIHRAVAEFEAMSRNRCEEERRYSVAEWEPMYLPLWIRDISAELARNPGPYANEYLIRDGGWWQRSAADITHLTFHHTLSDSPHATAAHYINKDGGRPTLPYTIWVTQTGDVLLCVPLTEGLWHDHTGHENVHLSVGLAGQLHLYRPAEVQLDAAAKVAVWTIQSDLFPKIDGIGTIKGHMDWIGTACPGWDSEQSGHWKPDLYEKIENALNQ